VSGRSASPVSPLPAPPARRGRAAAVLLLFFLAGCEGGPPVFEEVMLPAFAYADGGWLSVRARLRATPDLDRVDALILDEGRLRATESVAAAVVETRPGTPEGPGVWLALLSVPLAGDLVFVLEAEDAQGLRSRSPEGTDPLAVHRVPIRPRPGPCGDDLPPCPVGRRCVRGWCTGEICDAVFCPAGERCHPQQGRCVPADHCALPGNGCTGDLRCDEETGRCAEPDRCAARECPAGSRCRPADGRCYVPGGALCAPCTTREDCPAPESFCVLYGEERGCGQDCTNAPCPAGYECRRFGAYLQQCYRSSGSCDPETWE